MPRPSPFLPVLLHLLFPPALPHPLPPVTRGLQRRWLSASSVPQFCCQMGKTGDFTSLGGGGESSLSWGLASRLTCMKKIRHLSGTEELILLLVHLLKLIIQKDYQPLAALVLELPSNYFSVGGPRACYEVEGKPSNPSYYSGKAPRVTDYRLTA